MNAILRSLTASIVMLTAALTAITESRGQEEVDFVKQIKPIFEQHCFECHGLDEDEYEAFPINVKDEAMAYVYAESPEDSDLYQVMISDDEDWVMPPPDYKHQLSDEKKNTVKLWIEQGATWPEDVVFAEFVQPQEPPPVDSATQPPEMTEPPPATQETDADPAPADDSETSGETGDADEPASAGEVEDADNAEPEPAPIDPKTQQILNAMGSLHPAAIHIPIGLLLGAGLFALFGLRGNFVMSDCAYYCLWLGSLGAIAASVTGWYFSPMENRGTVETIQDLFNQDHKVFWHRTGALIVTAFSFILALFAASARSRDPDEGVMWKLGTILLACGIGWVGHTGGELHYPPNHYKDLNAVWEDVSSQLFPGPPGPTEASDESDSGGDDSSQIGTTSDEPGSSTAESDPDGDDGNG